MNQLFTQWSSTARTLTEKQIDFWLDSWRKAERSMAEQKLPEWADSNFLKVSDWTKFWTK